MRAEPEGRPARWLNRSVLGIGLASLTSDISHEIATTVLPAFLATLGAAAAWLGAIEGVSDGISSAAKLTSGFYTDRLARRKPIAVVGYAVTAFGTAAFGLASAAWHILLFRSLAWLGRGVRTPVRKALLAQAVTKETYGRAFGFERMMDTLGAVAGPSIVLVLLPVLSHDYAALFALTLVPGLLAAALIAFLVVERERRPVKRVTFGASFRALPKRFKRFLLAVGLFGLGDFSHTLLILFAAESLAPELGKNEAASLAAGLYVMHNVLYAGFAFTAGWLADRFEKPWLLSGGYFLAAAMAAALVLLPASAWTLALVFALGGIYIAVEETVEDSLCAQLVGEEQHGMAFGVLATVNGIGDFASSMVVGVLWTAFGPSVAFGYSAVFFAAGGVLVWRLRPSAA